MNNNTKQDQYEILDDGNLTVIGYIQRGGAQGVGLEFQWDGTKLGVKREDEKDFIWTELGGDLQISKENIIEILEYIPANKEDLLKHIRDTSLHVTEREKMLIASIEGKASKHELEDYMRTEDYDSNGDGIIDSANNAEKLGNRSAEDYALKEDINWNNLKDKPLSYPPSTHNHNGLYYTKAEVDSHTGDKNIHTSLEEKEYVLNKIEEILETIDGLDIPSLPSEDVKQLKEDVEKLKQEKVDISDFEYAINDILTQIEQITQPTLISELENDVGYITETHSSIQKINADISLLKINKADRTDLKTEVDRLNRRIDGLDIPEEVNLEGIKSDIETLKTDKADALYVDEALGIINSKDEAQDVEISNKINKSDVSKVGKTGEYEDILNTPDIPSKLSDLEIDIEVGKNYDKEIEKLEIGKADKEDIVNPYYLSETPPEDTDMIWVKK